MLSGRGRYLVFQLSRFIAFSGFTAAVQEGSVQAQMWSRPSHQSLGHHCCSLRQSIFQLVKPSITNLQDIRPSNLLVRVGEYHVLNTNEPDAHVDRRIKKVVTHRSFDKITYEYDIALLEMHDGPIKYQVASIPFPFEITFPSQTSSPYACRTTTTGLWVKWELSPDGEDSRNSGKSPRF